MTRKKQLSTTATIARLKIIANESYHKSGSLRKKSFVSALHCGDALLEIKSLVRWGNWKDWLENNFEGSYETAVVYMRIAKNWNDPRMVEARETMTIESIKAFQDVLKGRPLLIAPEEKPNQPTQDKLYERYRKYAIAEFTKQVNSLGRWKHWSRRYELFVLGDNFAYFWNGLYAELKRVAEKTQTKQRIDRSFRRSVKKKET